MWLAWDTAVFRAIHLGLHHPALDPVMRALTDPGALKIPFLVGLALVFLTRRLRGLIGLLALALTIAAADQTSSKVVKPIFQRARPSVVVADSRPLFGVRRTYSFPSGHATNFFAAAPVVGAVFPQARMAAYALAAAVSFSRVYVGDHWPSDALAGGLLGLGLGLLGRRAYRRANAGLDAWRRRPAAAPEEPFSGPARVGKGPNDGP
jgi:undecaprenyl-diphosphatase